VYGLYGFWWSPDGVHWIGDPWTWWNTSHFSVWLPFKLGVAWRTYKAPVGLWWRYSY
jgi:hypothetical protein